MKELTREAQLILIALCFLASLIFSLTVARYLNSPLRSEEVEGPTQVGGILRHGVPKVLYSEENLLRTAPYYGYDAFYGMWNPPLYLYGLSISAALFGIGNITMRVVSLIWFVMSLWLVWRITGFLSPKPNLIISRIITLALALLTPLLAEGSLYLDIDNTSLAFSLLIFIYFFLKSPEGNSWKRLLLLSFIFTFALWSKLTTPFIMLASVVVYHFLNKNFKKGIIQGLVIGGFGVGLFLLIYWIYCSLFNYPFWFMFDVNYFGRTDMYLLPHALKKVLHSLRWSFVWISPPIAIMLGVLILSRVSNYIRHRRVDKIDFLAIFSAAGLGIYTLWGGLWGKYIFPPVLVGVIAVGSQIPIYLKSIRITRPAIFLAIILILAVIHLVAVPALQVRRPGFDFQSAELWQALLDERNIYLFITIAAFVIFFFIARQFIEGRRKGTNLAAILSIYLLVANPINSMKIIFSPDDRSPYHSFRERGFLQTVQFLNDNMSQNDVILCPRDIGYYFKGRHYCIQTELAFGGLPELQKLITSPQISYIVDSQGYPTIPDRGSLLRSVSFVLIKRIGNFEIYQNQYTDNMR